MIALENILSQEIIQRLGWTLLHFIWQAMAVALLLAIMLRVMRKSTPSLRYIFACLALGLIVLLPIVTMQLIPVSVPYSAVNIEPVPLHPLSPTAEIPVAETVVLDEPVQPEIVVPVSTESWKQRTVESLESALPYIVSGWLVGVFALSLWHLGGWAQLQRLRRKMVKQVDGTLHSKLKVLAQRLRVNQTVQLVESALVQIPTVVGWLRPVILLPASALTGLTSEQLEAILAHELAHIKRFDYLINILQTVVEILGFYHPAVWWVSHKIRAERENCCDDLAVSISGDRVCYARALTSMEEIRAGRGQLVRSGGLAVAATGGTLLERIRRLVGKDAAEKNSFSCVPAATVILLIIALAIPATITLTARAQGMPEGLGGAVIKGIRANRDKFECGYLAWSSKQITTRFADSNRPATKLAGQYELWWDGKKIATKYVRDQVYKDPEGNFRVEKGQGGTSYDGGVLSWKPDFHSDNWLGPEFTRWRGLGSQDWLIQQDSKQASISREWSVVDTNGVKLIRFTVKNMNETDRDYGGYSIRDYDPSKGYGLVNEEWYNPNGSPRLKHTVKMLEVMPGGWFPVEVDFKSFTITDGRVYTHHHHALDIERCSFNDKSALPARVFKGAVDKQLKYQEKLQKYLAMELRGISDVKEAAKADRVKHGAREATEKFVAAAMAGDLEKAGKFAHPGKLPANQIADLNQIAKGQNLWIMAVVADDFDAIAVSSVIQGDHNRIGPLVFFLNREPQDGRDNWWVHDIDMETPDGAEAELKQFLEKHPKAEKIPSEKKPAVQVEGDILLGTLKVKDSSADNIPTVLPTIAKSPPPSAEDKTIIQVDCLVVEVFTDLKMDRETTIVAENILGKEKVTTVPRGQGFISRSTTAALLLREAAEATAPKEDGSAGDKRVTQDQFKALVEMLASRGLMKILMNPRIQVLDGKMAKITSAQKISSMQGSIEDLIQITPHVLEDGHITLQVEATISSKSKPKGIEQIPIVSKREISTRVRTSSGESLIIGGLTEKDPAPGDNVKNSKKRTAEVMFILTPTIITPATDSQEKTDVQIKVKRALSADKLKWLGLAVAMYADDHDKQLPDTLEPLKPYIANEQDYLWLLDNVEYALKETETKYFSNRPNIPVAYDKTQKEKQSGANVLFLDGHVEFLTPQRLSELDIKRAKFLIETWFLAVNKDFIENINHNADSPDEAKELFKLKSELLAALDGSNKLSFIPSERNVSLLLKAVRAHKDSKVLAAPQVICLEDKTAKIKVMNNETYYIVGYTEPNSPSEKPQPKLEKVEEGIALSLRPNLTPNNNIDMQFEFQISKFLDSEERKFQGKAPYKPPKVQRTAQSLAYRVLNGQTLLFGGHKIADQQDGRTEQKDLLILIKAHTIGSSEQDKPAMVKYPIVTKPPRTTIDVITKPAIAKSRTERPEDNEQEQTKSATEQKPLMVQKIFKLKHHNSSQMGQIILPLVGEYGHISADERTNNLLVIDTTENLTRIEKIIAQFDVSIAEQAVQKSFKLKYRSPSQMAQILRPLLTKTGHVSADESTRILLLIDTPENLKRIEKIIAAFDVLQADKTVQKFFKLKNYSPSQMAQILRPLLSHTGGHISTDERTNSLLVIDTAENLMRIEKIIAAFDVSKAKPTVTEIFKIRYGDPVQIVELLKKLINGPPGFGSIIEPGKEPIVLVPEPSRKWIIAKASAENMKQIGQWIEKLDREELAPTSLEQIDQQIIKQQKILKMRQEYINNDPVVKAISENVAKTEAELIAARQKFAQSHPKVRQKDRVLQLLKKRLNDMITALGKSFDDMMLPEPNLPLAPEVPLITNTWLESDMLEVLQDIASMAGIPIIPDETVVGSVTAELKDVPLEKALDIVLAGTPYVVKKTPYYYLVASALEPPEIQRRVYSAKKLSNLGKALLIYANDHDDKYPDSLHHLSEYSNVEELKWVLANVEYLARGKTIADRPDTVIAYDKKLLVERKGTNVLFNDGHVEFVKPERLKKLGISTNEIQIETQILFVSEDFLQSIGLDANSVSSSDAWSEHFVADSAAEPNAETYSLILDELHVRFLLKAVQAHKGTKVLTAPRATVHEGKTAEIKIMTRYPVLDYNEPNDASDEPQPKTDYVDIGTHIWLKPELTPDKENVNLDFKLEISQLKGIIEGKYKGKYPYHKPIVDVISTEARTVVPNGKTLLIGGLKINEQVKKEPRAPRLKDLPLIGGLFSSTIKEPKMLLILVKPTITPQQKASKILPGQADSE